ncbi:Potassium voltage-gated channel subfamily H member 6 [Hondaea fermentalgiana]|uniref:Potassium voltage-gated channel subfamily H member 6 n=1 Tax=Hondaea fermentalgiana TaxID=2315210 RepID=A0A2R5G8H1_9STRA|nr:Potassium voltage-gated channel subfamily H member 6 [Hondaea fermentalgiana]|eukprot:GBG27347.1 Potassium voltage-gated channel subfamily H member 6 [Hondaea fermentalgiana]
MTMAAEDAGGETAQGSKDAPYGTTSEGNQTKPEVEPDCNATKREGDQADNASEMSIVAVSRAGVDEQRLLLRSRESEATVMSGHPASGDSLVVPRRAVVMREIEIQKAKVREKFALLKALEHDESYTNKQKPNSQMLQEQQQEQEQGHQPPQITSKQRRQAAKRYAELESLRTALDEAQNEESVFPEWLSRREDFQCVFPRYSSKPMELEDLVLFGMDKEVKLRTSMDIDTTVRFVQRCPAFKDMSPDLCRGLTKFMHISRHPPGTTLFEQNEAANVVYFILRGCVELRRGPSAAAGGERRQEEIQLGATFTRKLRRGECCGIEALSLDLDRTNRYEARCVADDTACSGSSDTRAVKSPGAEESLAGAGASSMYASMRRSPLVSMDETAVSAPDIVLLALSGQDCRTTTKVHLQSQHARLSKFLQTQLPLFRGWSKHRVNQVAPLLVERRYRPGDVIQRTGDPAGDLFFVYQGTCDAEREVSRVHTNRWPKALSRDRAANLRGIEHEQRETRMVKSVKLAELRPGTYFGEEALIGYSKRRTTVTATRMTTLLCLPKENLHEMFSTRMVQDIKQRHDALFTSDEEILAEHEHTQRLEREYELLKRAAFGPAYLRRAQQRRLQAQGDNNTQHRSRGVRHSQSAPLLTNTSVVLPSRTPGKALPKSRASGKTRHVSASQSTTALPSLHTRIRR